MAPRRAPRSEPQHWQELVAEIAPHGSGDPVLAAMLRRDRKRFLPRVQRRAARFNRPVHLGYGQTNSQPTTVAQMLWLLDVRSGHRVLDVGAGTGWSTAILGDLVGSEGCILGVERLPVLAERAVKNIAREQLAHCTIRVATPGVLGAPDEAPFDRILVSAEPAHLPQELVEQLAPGGIMVITVAGTMLRVEKTSDDVRITSHGHYRFVELIV